MPSEERERREDGACLYGTEYYELEEVVVGILVAEVSGSPVMGHGCAANRNTSGCATRK